MIGALVAGLLAAALVTQKAEPLERVGHLAATAIREASGIVASRRHPGIFWVHNDSQNEPELFAVRGDGQLVRSYKVAVPNIDWEDIATDDAGHLYLADTGNNHLALPVRAIHTLNEPDPTSAASALKPLPILASTHYKFAGDRRFDAEGLVVVGKQALVVTKRRDGKLAEVYRVTIDPPASLFWPTTPTRVGSLAGCVEPVTGATLTRDGQTLAVVTDLSVRVYRSTDLTNWSPIAFVPFREADVEAITWDGDDLLLASENRGMYRGPGEPVAVGGGGNGGGGAVTTPDVVIVGGGVIGLSIGYALTREGANVTVLDRQELGRAASWAGAGMIPPYAERLTTNPVLDLRSWSALLYPEWSAALLGETGIDNGFRRTGGVDVAATPHEDDELRSMAGRWRAERVAYERLAPADFGRVEPALNPDLLVAYWLPDRAQIRNPRHIQALQASLRARRSVLRPQARVVGFDRAGDRVVAVRTEADTIPCGTVVVAAGAWSAGLLSELDLDVPTPPLKGQIVLLNPGRPLIRRIIEHGRMYLVPRDDHRVLIGATEETTGFDDRTTAQASDDLIAEACHLCPILAEAAVEQTWAGLRPGSVDSRPYLGPAPGWANVLVATGHKRAGIQLAPATAEVVTDLIMGRTPRVDLDPFRLDREPGFAAEASFRS